MRVAYGDVRNTIKPMASLSSTTGQSGVIGAQLFRGDGPKPSEGQNSGKNALLRKVI